MAQSDIVLDIRDLKKSFGEIEIIRGVDLTVRRNERHAIIGPNGAGKSTLFNLISGRLRATSGSILLNGTPIETKAPHLINRAGLGRSFQINSLFPQLSTFEHLRFGRLSRQGIRYSFLRPASSWRGAGEETRSLLQDIGLSHRSEEAGGSLSYSEQRSLEIGMSLSTDPDIILLDEPTAGMSRDETRRAVELIRRTTEGKTLLVVEHDMDVVFSLCDVVSVLVYGQIIATGTPEEIRSNRKVQEAYLGVEIDEHA
ncbi:MAG: ABC transporter ATP-binding protein [Rhizobiaceae bacterium]|nr:ABC transporter ATP-binding protein [Rhizobiaceae bacterium]